MIFTFTSTILCEFIHDFSVRGLFIVILYANPTLKTVQSKPPVTLPQTQLFLLGTAHLERSEQTIRVHTRKGIGLLAYLALEGAQSRARLAEIFWGQYDEARGRMNLRRELQRLRDLGLDQILTITNSSLQLVQTTWCDATQFQSAILNGDLQQATKLWSGTFLQGLDAEEELEFDVWLERTRARLQAQHLDALHAFAKLSEEKGEYRQAQSLYQQILTDDNLNESVYRSLIRLHGILNEREQALDTYAQLEHLLHEDLGLTPLPETISLIEQIRADVKPSKNQPKKSSNDLIEPPFVGRDDILSDLQQSQSQIHILLGEPGVGKSRLAAEYLKQHGSHLRLQGREDWRGITLAPITAILKQHQQQLTHLNQNDRLEISRLLPELEPNQRNLEAPSLEGRTRFLQALANTLQLLLATKTLLVDDLQWLDESTINVLTLLFSQTNQKAIFTARETELNSDFVRVSLATLERQGHLKKIQMKALSEIDVLEMVRQLSGSENAIEFSKSLFDATGGNPFFTLETIRHLFATGFLENQNGLWEVNPSQAQYTELPIPGNLKTMILERVTRLGASVQRLLEAASLNGAIFELNDLEGATALGEWDALEALEQSVQAQLIRPLENGYRFSHDIVRRTLENAIGTDRKSRIHRKLAYNAIAKNALPERIAEHLDAANDALQALNYRFLATQRLEQLNLFEAAITQLNLALKLIQTLPKNLEHDLWLVKIKLKMGNLKHELSDYKNAKLEFEQALEITKTLQNPALQSESLSGLARVAGGLSSYASVLTGCLESVKLARESQDPLITARALYWLGNTEFQMGNIKQATKHLKESLQLQEQHGGEDMVATINILLGRIATSDKNHARAIEYYRTALESNRKIGYLKGTALCLTGISWRALLVKDFSEAEQTARESLSLYQKLGGPWLVANALTNLAHALVGNQNLIEAKQHYRQALEMSLEINALNITLEILVGIAKILLESQQPELAGRFLAVATTHERSTFEIKDYAAPVMLEWQMQSKAKVLPTENSLTEIIQSALVFLQITD